jgi:hypothetical protein
MTQVQRFRSPAAHASPSSVSSVRPPEAGLALTIKWMEWDGSEATLATNTVYEINCDSQDYPFYLPCSNPGCDHGGYPIGPFVAKMLHQGESCQTDSLVCCQRETYKQGCGHWINFVLLSQERS